MSRVAAVAEDEIEDVQVVGAEGFTLAVVTHAYGTGGKREEEDVQSFVFPGFRDVSPGEHGDDDGFQGFVETIRREFTAAVFFFYERRRTSEWDATN